MPKKIVSLLVIATFIIQNMYPASGKVRRLSQEVSPRTLTIHSELFMSILNPPPLKHIGRALTPPPQLIEYTVSFIQQPDSTPLSPAKVYEMPTEHPLITKVWNILEGTPLSPLPIGDLLRSLGCLSEENIAHFESQLATLTPFEKQTISYDQDDDLEYIDTQANPVTPTPRTIMNCLKSMICQQKNISPTAEQIQEFTRFLHCVRVEDLDNVIDSERKWTLLHIAVWNKQPIYAHLLLRFKADPNVRDFHGRTPLLLAIIVAHAPMIDLLLRYDANPDIQGKTDFGMVTPLEYIEQCFAS